MNFIPAYIVFNLLCGVSVVKGVDVDVNGSSADGENDLSDIGIDIQIVPTSNTTLNELKAAVQSIMTRLDSLTEKINLFLENQNENAVVFEIAEDILRGRFNTSAKRLFWKEDEVLISKVINKVYTRTAGNFELLLNFTMQQNVENSCKILKTLYNLYLKHDLHDSKTLLQFLKTFKSKAYDQSETFIGTETVGLEILKYLKKTAAKFWIEAMNAMDFESSGTEELTAALYTIPPTLYNVFRLLVEGAYGKVNLTRLLEKVYRFKNFDVAIEALRAIFREIRNNVGTDESIIVSLASKLSKLGRKFPALHESMNKDFAKILNEIPECVKSIYFSSTVRLWNVAKESNLIVDGSSFDDRKNLHNIFIGKIIYKTYENRHELDWHAEDQEDHIRFYSPKFPEECLCAGYQYNDNNPKLDYVLSSDRRSCTNNKFTIEPVGEYCYLKSTYNKQYVAASNVTYKKNRNFSYVFLSEIVHPQKKPEFLWRIESVDMV